MGRLTKPSGRGGAGGAPASTTPTPTPIMGSVSEGWRLQKEWYPLLPHTKLMLYGESGTGKSTMAATYVEVARELDLPVLVVGFDPPSKMSPYREVGYDVTEVSDPEFAAYYDQLGVRAEDVVDKDGKLLLRIEMYIDDDLTKPNVIDALEARFGGFGQDAPNWFAVIRDSMSFLSYAALQRAKARLPIDAANEARGQTTNITWYNMAKQDVEREVKSRGLWWKTNLVDIYHTSEEKTEFADTIVRGISAIGKLKDELPYGYDEIYKVRIDPKRKTEDGNFCRFLQTRHDNVWTATSVTAKAPNPCEPNYRALWRNWQAMKEAKGVTPTG